MTDIITNVAEAMHQVGYIDSFRDRPKFVQDELIEQSKAALAVFLKDLAVVGLVEALKIAKKAEEAIIAAGIPSALHGRFYSALTAFQQLQQKVETL